MSWPIEALGGPVLAWELKQAARRKLRRSLQISYCAWLMIQALALLGAIDSTTSVLPEAPYRRLDLCRAIYAQQLELLDNYLDLLLQYQLVLVMAIIPAIT